MRLKNELIVICLILFILISISAVSAENTNSNLISINNNDNDNVLDINNLNNNEILTNENDGSFADLDAKINGNSSTNIVLDKNYTYSSTDTIKTGILISKNNTVIDGQGHTIDAKGNSRMFNVTATTVTLKNINFINGNSVKSGGAIYGYGENLRVINCTFTDNNAASWGGAIFSYPDSYAIYVNSTFINNKAKYGGAIAAYYGFRHNIINCTFDSNYASEEGGAIGIYGQLATTERPYDDTVNIRGCLFTNNDASNGSAIANILSAYINMTDSVILGSSENLIYSWGAMFFAENNWWGNTVENKSVKPDIAKGVTFSKWLYFDFVPHIETSTATVSINNLYDGETGQTSIYSTSRLPSVNVEFSGINTTFAENNVYLDHSGKYEIGFALQGNAVLTANSSNAVISKKMKVGGLKELELLIANADDGSLIKLDKDYVYTEGIDNKIGVAISGKHDLVIDGNGHSINGMGKSRVFLVYGDSSDITFKNMNIVGGYTDDGADGAGAYLEARNVDFINCTFLNNIANGYGSGAALHVNGKNAKVIDCSFINNSHLYSSGGAISWANGEAYIINSLFENNTALFTQGGALMMHSNGNIVNCTFIRNSAGHAGAIFSYNSLNISDCTFTSNIALTEDSSVGAGGAVYVNTDAYVNITNSIFNNNSATTGASIYAYYAMIDKCIFINNTASNGIVVSRQKDSIVINSIFLNNHIVDTDTTFGTYIAGYIYADYNWFGHVSDNYTKTPVMRISNGYGVTKWLFLNATSPIKTGNNLQTRFTFLVYDTNTKMVAQYDMDDMPSVDLKLSGQNITLKQENAFVGEDVNGITTYYKGNLIAEYETVKYVVPFVFREESYFIVNSTFNIIKDQSKYLGAVVYPFNEDSMYFLYNAGRITFTINDTSIFTFDKATDKIKGLKVGLATITFKFDGKNVIGEDKYTPSNVTVLVNVSKAETRIINSTSAPSDTFVGDNSNFIVSVVDGKNKSIRGATLEVINNNPDVINLYVSGSNLQYKTLTEGLANITVKFAGNDNYLPSSRDFTFQVGRKDPNIRLSDENISILVSHDYLIGIFTSASHNFTYISNDTNVAVMDENGVHGIGDGVANITIRFGGDAKYYPVDVYLIVNVKGVKTYIDVNQTKLMYLTDVEYINAVVRDENGKFIGYATEFTSNDTSVVSVNETRLDAVGVGKALVSIKYNGRYEYSPSTVDVIVTVETATNNINVVSDVEIQIDQRINLNATLDYGRGLLYESSNSSVVTVDSRGYIKGIKTGEANITITYEGSEKYDPSSKNVTVRVVKVPTSIDVASSLAWIIGENDTVNAALNPQNAGTLTFTSNNESVVTINQTTGKIAAVGVGKTAIEISYAGTEKYAAVNRTVEVNVYKSYIPTSIVVNESFELFVDDAIDIGAILNPANAGKLDYVSSDESVVSVNQTTGKITAVGVGKANVTVSFSGNNAYLPNSTTVLVTVSLIPTSIEANKTITLNKTEDAAFEYVFSHPEAGSVKTSFTNPSIAHIENGRIIADKVGKTVLTLKFNGNEKYTASNATIEIIVVDVETSIDVADTLEVNLTETESIVARLNPQEVGKLRFGNYDNTIISIDTNGKVTGLKLGSTNVTVSFKGEGKYRASNRTITVIVKDVETNIDVNDSIGLNLSETGSIVARLNPQQAGKLQFNTNDNEIISLDEKGNIKGLKVGTASVLITFNANGKYRASNKTVTVTVSDVVTEINVDNTNVELIYGDETNLNATLSPIEAGKLAYSTSDSSVVTVDENGNIKAIKPGMAIITISYDGKAKYRSSNKTVAVNVSRAPSSIIINDTLELQVGVAQTIKPYTDPSNIKLNYATNDSETISIDENGFVQALRHGSAIITINFTGNEYYLPSNATVKVNIKSMITEIRVNNTVTIGYGESRSLGAIIFIPVANYPLDGKLKYISSNPNIVSVDENVGLITANNIGKANITVIYEGSSIFAPSNATVNVEVLTRTTNVKIDEPSVSLYVDDTNKISAGLLNGPENYVLHYFSSNPAVVGVNGLTGEITARKEGTAIITVSYGGDDEYHSSEANVSVSVLKYKTQIKSQNTFELEVKNSVDLNAMVTPNDGILTYKSSDVEIVSVDAFGKIKALKSGSAVITIKFAGDNKYLPSEKQVIINVSRIKTSINLDDMELFAGEEYELKNVVVPDGAPTRAKYYEYTSDDLEVFDVDNGLITTFHEGTAELYVEFKGDDIYAPSSKTVTVTVVKRVISQNEYNFTVEVDDIQRKATFTLYVPEDAEGMFQVIINGEPYAENIEDGKAVVEVYDLEPGDYKATLRFTGDEKYASINNATTFHLGQYKIDKNNDVDVTLGDYVVYSVHLTRDTQAMEGKKVKFIVNNRVYKAYTDRLGYATVKFKLYAMGTYTIVAKYAGLKVKNNIRVHLIVANNVKAKKTKDLKIQIALKKVNNKYLSGKKVTLKFNGKKYKAYTSKKGVATFTISKSVLNKLKTGKYKYKVYYSTDVVTRKIKLY
ncbi:MAG: Ig-like domain-containing protein [Methanobrevibacter sp.]|nr:Ig-like domain-containing protein [Methanobrevibacter sp.]